MPDGIDYLINMAGRLVCTLLRTSFLMLYPQLKLHIAHLAELCILLMVS